MQKNPVTRNKYQLFRELVRLNQEMCGIDNHDVCMCVDSLLDASDRQVLGEKKNVQGVWLIINQLYFHFPSAFS